MSPEQLVTLADSVIEQTMATLPEPIRRAAEACVIQSAFMMDTRVDEEGIDDELLGLFEGFSLQEGPPETAEQLPRIRLFVDNLWDYSEGDRHLFREEVRTTLLHELGHFLGFDEDQVAALGLA